MSAVDEATDVFTVVRGTIAPELERALAASRADPLPAAPNALAAEPGHSQTLFARILGETPSRPADSRTPQRTSAVDTAPAAADPAGASATELLAAFAAGATTPEAVLDVLAPLWTADA
ncbi:MAG: amidase, partial [Curtobacterium sp.]